MRLLPSCVSSPAGQEVGCPSCPPGELSPSPSISRKQPVGWPFCASQSACCCMLSRALSSARVFVVNCPRKLVLSATVPSSRSSIRCTRARRASCPVLFSCGHASLVSKAPDSEGRRPVDATNRCCFHLDGRDGLRRCRGSLQPSVGSYHHEGKIRLGFSMRWQQSNEDDAPSQLWRFGGTVTSKALQQVSQATSSRQLEQCLNEGESKVE